MKKQKKKKINPRNKPASKADVERAKAQGRDNAIDFCWSVIFTVLHDKYGYAGEALNEMWNNVNKLACEIAEKRVSVPDLRKVLADEENIIVVDTTQDTCDCCKWKGRRHQKCSCCRDNPKLKTNWELKDGT